MRALLFREYGDPNVLTVDDVPEPHAGPGEIRIAVRAAGVSPGDDSLRSGRWREIVPLVLPYVVGLDAAGVVDEVGAGVDDVKIGDEVFGLRLSGHTTAEYAVLDAWTRKPPAMSWPQAGGAAGSVETAVRALSAVDVGRGDTVLLDGAAGGVGAIAAQIAVARGARVIGTASAANHPFLESLGVIPVEYGPGLVERVGHRVDAAIDVAGRGSVADLVTLTGDAAAVVTVANPGATEHGVRMLRFDPAADNAASLAQGGALVETGQLVVHVAQAYAMDEGAAAHARVASGHARGKVVITVR